MNPELKSLVEKWRKSRSLSGTGDVAVMFINHLADELEAVLKKEDSRDAEIARLRKALEEIANCPLAPVTVIRLAESALEGKDK